MIRPRARLTLWFGLVALPFGAVAGLLPVWAPVCLLAVGAFVALAAVDAWRAPRPLRGMSASLPDVVRLTKDRPGEFPIGLRREGDRGGRSLALGLSLPASVEAAEEVLHVRLAEGAASCRVTWPCTPHRRGQIPVRQVYVEVASPLGFWGSNTALPAAGTLRVYPNLLTERRQLAALFLNRRGVGIHAQRQVGQGREFEKLREYLPGDSSEDIHWRATAKRGRPITKQYQIERTQEIYVILDASRMSARDVPDAAPAADDEETPRNPDTVLEYFVRTALVLGLVAEKQGDLFGLASFSDRVHRFVRARGGRGHFHTCRDALYTLETAPVTPDFSELCAFLRTRLRRRALLVFLTSLDDPQLAESFEKNMELLGNQHIVIAAMFRPRGAVPLFRSPARDTEEVYDALAGHMLWDGLRQVALSLRRRGVTFLPLEREHLCAALVSRYMSIKQRQIL
ncbi:MAG: DUF58 domain-containing protein [Lentisphaeria bacterium]|nr:DUF58 domain-containing protein [Lentisphaeria bacterium]